MEIYKDLNSKATKEFEQSCERIFYYASMADKFEGNIHNPPMRGLTLAVKEPICIIASLMCEYKPLLSLTTNISSLFANGNASLIVPSEKTSLIATSLYQVFETSDIPAGSLLALNADGLMIISTCKLLFFKIIAVGFSLAPL